MHRVELKATQEPPPATSSLTEFLMHRVELKAYFFAFDRHKSIQVPNAPCGVESLCRDVLKYVLFRVPNAPCGVESSSLRGSGWLFSMSS